MLGRSIFASCAALRLARRADEESSRPAAPQPTSPTHRQGYRRVVIREGVPQLVPGVMVSAVNQKDKLAECIRAGAIDFIVKPFEKATLRRFFEKYLTAQHQK